MEFIPMTIPGVVLVKPRAYRDIRGFFMETYNLREFEVNGIPSNFVQDNHSGSKQSTLRGMHYQIRQPQGKLVGVVIGSIFDVAIDMRRSSPTFGQWVGVVLSAENKHRLWIPPGFAHGFYALSPWVEFMYKVTDYYSPEWERCLLWDDPYVGIKWPLIKDQKPILSDKDAQGLLFNEASVYD